MKYEVALLDKSCSAINFMPVKGRKLHGCYTYIKAPQGIDRVVTLHLDSSAKTFTRERGGWRNPQAISV